MAPNKSSSLVVCMLAYLKFGAQKLMYKKVYVYLALKAFAHTIFESRLCVIAPILNFGLARQDRDVQ